MTLLDAEQLSAVLDGSRWDLFRIETLPAYATPTTSPDFQRWLDGDPGPDWSVRQKWLDLLARWADEGRPRRRVRIIHDPVSAYERYACEWGYVNNVRAGEPTRVIDLAETRGPVELDAAPGDWWLIDGRDVVAMHYDPDGQFRGAEVLDAQHAPRHRAAMDAAWRVAEDFTTWWDRHPEHRRSAHHAA